MGVGLGGEGHGFVLHWGLCVLFPPSGVTPGGSGHSEHFHGDGSHSQRFLNKEFDKCKSCIKVIYEHTNYRP